MNGMLIYLICSIADPTLCEEHALLTTSVLPCIHGAQAELATAVRPGWRVARWQCRSGVREAPETTESDIGIVARRTGPADLSGRP
jgi:hypothetical protein